MRRLEVLRPGGLLSSVGLQFEANSDSIRGFGDATESAADRRVASNAAEGRAFCRGSSHTLTVCDPASSVPRVAPLGSGPLSRQGLAVFHGLILNLRFDKHEVGCLKPSERSFSTYPLWYTDVNRSDAEWTAGILKPMPGTTQRGGGQPSSGPRSTSMRLVGI
jgi:hypothetical protein